MYDDDAGHRHIFNYLTLIVLCIAVTSVVLVNAIAVTFYYQFIP